jgi:hypothetical protein
MRSPFLAYGEFTINFILLPQGAAAIKAINLIRLKKNQSLVLKLQPSVTRSISPSDSFNSAKIRAPLT